MTDFGDTNCGGGKFSQKLLKAVGFQGKFSRMCYAHDKAQEDKLKGEQYEPKTWEEIDEEADRNAYRLAITEYSKSLPARYIFGTAWNLVLVGGSIVATRSWNLIRGR